MATSIPERDLGSLRIPALITGMWQVAGGHGKIDVKKALEEMKTYTEADLGTFDLADIYGPAEAIFGMFLKQYTGNKRVQGLTKFVPQPGPMTRALVEASIDRSRKNMGVQTLDLVQFHWWDYDDPNYLYATQHLKQLQWEGKVLELALTNFDTDHMDKILASGCQFVSNQVAYSIIDRRPEKKMVSWCLKHNVKLLAYGTLLGGFLSNKYFGKPEPTRRELTTSSLAKYKRTIDQWGGWNLFQELLLVLKRVSEKYAVSISNVAVRYIADQPAVAAVIIGARLSIAEHIFENLQTFNFPGIDDEDKLMIEQVVRRGRELPGDCGDEYR